MVVGGVWVCGDSLLVNVVSRCSKHLHMFVVHCKCESINIK